MSVSGAVRGILLISFDTILALTTLKVALKLEYLLLQNVRMCQMSVRKISKDLR